MEQCCNETLPHLNCTRGHIGHIMPLSSTNFEKRGEIKWQITINMSAKDLSPPPLLLAGPPKNPFSGFPY